MLNAQHYYEELSIVLSNTKKPLTCAIRAVKDKVDYKKEPKCRISYRYCDKCKRDMKEWFFSEYEPEELINGDDLTQGQIIEVYRKSFWGSEEFKSYWEEKEFLFYANGRFWALEDSPDVAVGWERARLPKKVDDAE